MKLGALRRWLAALTAEPWTNAKTKLQHRVRAGRAVTANSLRTTAARCRFVFPRDYVAVVQSIGLLALESTDGKRRWTDNAMLAPRAITALHGRFRTWVAEDDLGAADDQREAARQEQAVRAALIPFQYRYDDAVSDMWCFHRTMARRGQPLVELALHDDFELALTIGDAPTYGFAAHLQHWLCKMNGAPKP